MTITNMTIENQYHFTAFMLMKTQSVIYLPVYTKHSLLMI